MVNKIVLLSLWVQINTSLLPRFLSFRRMAIQKLFFMLLNFHVRNTSERNIS